jgi:hypothetical protein
VKCTECRPLPGDWSSRKAEVVHPESRLHVHRDPPLTPHYVAFYSSGYYALLLGTFHQSFIVPVSAYRNPNKGRRRRRRLSGHKLLTAVYFEFFSFWVSIFFKRRFRSSPEEKIIVQNRGKFITRFGSLEPTQGL